MREEKVIEYLLKKKGIHKEELDKVLENWQKTEDIVSFLTKTGLLSYEDLNSLAEYALSKQPIHKKTLNKQGLTFEDTYFQYTRDDGVTYTIPYYHIKTIEKIGNIVNIYTGCVKKVSIPLENEDVANAFLDVLLLHIDRTFIQRFGT